MHRRLRRDILLSQVALFGGWGVCILIVPSFLFERDEGGLSNFGVHLDTVVPYTLAFVGCSCFLLRGARRIGGSDALCRRYRVLLESLSVLLVLTLVSTYWYKLNGTLKAIHVAIGITVVVFEALSSAWIAVRLCRSATSVLVLCAQLAGSALAAATLVGAVHLLFVAQIVSSAAFGTLLVLGAGRVEARLDTTAGR